MAVSKLSLLRQRDIITATLGLLVLVTLGTLYFLSQQTSSYVLIPVSANIGNSHEYLSNFKSFRSAPNLKSRYPSSWQVLGCYVLESPPAKTSRTSTKTFSIQECLTQCNRTAIVSIFRESDGACYCTEKYSSSSPAVDCSAPQVYWIGISRNVTGILLDQINQSGDWRCACKERSCDRVTCSAADPTSQCWVGPAPNRLARFSLPATKRCERNHYHLIWHSNTSKISQFCLSMKDMYGFWPISSCERFVSGSKRSHLYHIYTTQGEGGVTFRTTQQPNQTQIVLTTSFRSGSTFASQLFASNPNAYFLFEPLNSIGFENRVDGFFRRSPIKAALSNIVRCNLWALSNFTFNKCVPDEKITDLCNTSLISYSEYLMSIWSGCVSQPVLAIKVIMISLESVSEVAQMNRDRNIKVVSLIRDPRAMASSWMAAPEDAGIINRSQAPKLIVPAIKELCKHQGNAVMLTNDLRSLGSQGVFSLHYEELVFNTKQITTRLYRNLGLDSPPDEVINTMISLTSGSFLTDNNIIYGSSRVNHSDFYGVVRSDSKLTAYNWKSNLTWTIIEQIDKVCEPSYKYTGYCRVTNQHSLADDTLYFNDFLNRNEQQ